tara:strand:- start:8280 stop:9026 length:747 start_codon:yes stop_codon:yes gene_type:complete
MSLNVAQMKGGSGKKFVEQDLIEVGTYPARIAQIIDLGMQAQSEQQRLKYGEKPPKRKVQLTYELVDEFMKDENGEELEDKPRWVSERFNLLPLKSQKATSTARYNAIDPRMDFGGDFTLLVGQPVMVTITQYESRGVQRNGVGEVSAMRARDAERCPELVNEPKVFVLDDPDIEVFNSLPKFLQDIIKENVEYPGSRLEELLEGDSPTPEPEAEVEEQEAPKAKRKPSRKPVAPEPEEEEDEDERPW